MDAKGYGKILGQLADQVHELHAATGKAIDDIGGTAQVCTAEWALLYNLMRMAGVMADLIRDAEQPRPSALTDDDDADVAMVCTVCRGPVVRYTGGGLDYWAHTDDLDASDCTQTGPIQAMVAAGAEGRPLDTA